jgi:hypothetical protein
MFGGQGNDAAGNYGDLNDFWKFDGTYWTWMGGSTLIDDVGHQGTKGVPAAENIPSARLSGVFWKDSQGRFWLWGGGAADNLGVWHPANDLWVFDGQNWAWTGGGESADLVGTYGTKGVESFTNIMPGRLRVQAWVDSSDNIWIFGGWDNRIGGNDYYNDFWKGSR